MNNKFTGGQIGKIMGQVSLRCIKLYYAEKPGNYMFSYKQCTSWMYFYKREYDVATICDFTVYKACVLNWLPSSEACNPSGVLRKSEGRMHDCETPLTPGCSFHSGELKGQPSACWAH